MKFKTLHDVDVRGKRVVVREDLNVPMKDGAIGDETRITAALATLRYLHEHGAKTIILSHLGRPDGERQAKYTLRPVAARLAELLGTPTQSSTNCTGVPSNSASRAATGRSVYFACRSPSGRPRCDRMTVLAPCSCR